MADGEVIQAMIQSREAGQELVAIVHSHPSSPPTLSRTDKTEAFYPDAVLIVVSFQSDTPIAAGWILSTRETGHFREIALRVFN